MSDDQSNDFVISPSTKGLTLISSYSSSPSPSPSPPPNTDTVPFSHSPPPIIDTVPFSRSSPSNTDTVSFSRSPPTNTDTVPFSCSSPPNTDTVSFSRSPPPNTDTVSISQSSSLRHDSTISENNSRDSPSNPCHTPLSDTYHAPSLASPDEPVSPPSQSPDAEKSTNITRTEQPLALVEDNNAPTSPSDITQVDDHSTTLDNPAVATGDAPVSPSGIMHVRDQSTTPDDPAIAFGDAPISPSDITEVDNHSTTPDDPATATGDAPISPTSITQVDNHSTTLDNPATATGDTPVSPSGIMQVGDQLTTPDNPGTPVDHSNANDEEIMEVEESSIGETERISVNMDSEIRVAAVEDTVGGVVTNTDESMDIVRGVVANTDESMDTIEGVVTNTDESMDTEHSSDHKMIDSTGYGNETEQTQNESKQIHDEPEEGQNETESEIQNEPGKFQNETELVQIEPDRIQDEVEIQKDSEQIQNEPEQIQNEPAQIQDELKEIQNKFDEQIQNEPEQIRNEPVQFQSESKEIANKIQVDKTDPVLNDEDSNDGSKPVIIQAETGEIQSKNESDEISPGDEIESNEHYNEFHSKDDIRNETDQFQTEPMNSETPSVTDTSEIIPIGQHCSVEHEDMTNSQHIEYTENTAIVFNTSLQDSETKTDEVEEMVSSTDLAATDTGLSAKLLGELTSDDLKEDVPFDEDSIGNTAEEHGKTTGVVKSTDLLGEGLATSRDDLQVKASDRDNSGMDTEMTGSGMDESEMGMEESKMEVDESGMDELPRDESGMDELPKDESGMDELENTRMDESPGDNSCFEPQEVKEEDSTPSVVVAEIPPMTDICPSNIGSTEDPSTDSGVCTSTSIPTNTGVYSSGSDPLTGQPVEVESTETVDNPPITTESTESAMVETAIGNNNQRLRDGEADDFEVRAGTGSSEAILDTGSGEELLDSGSGEEVLNTGSGEEVLDTGSREEILDTGSGEEILDTGSREEILDTGSGEVKLDTGSREEKLDTGSGEAYSSIERSGNISVSDPANCDASTSVSEHVADMEDGDKLNSPTQPPQQVSMDTTPDIHVAVARASELPDGKQNDNEEGVVTTEQTLSFGMEKSLSDKQPLNSVTRLIEPSTGTVEQPVSEDHHIKEGPHPLEADLEKEEYSDTMAIKRGSDDDNTAIEKGPDVAIEKGPDVGIEKGFDDNSVPIEKGSNDDSVPVEKGSDDKVPVEKGYGVPVKVDTGFDDDDGVPIEKISDDDGIPVEEGSNDHGAPFEKGSDDDGVPVERGFDNLPVEKETNDDGIPVEEGGNKVVPVERVSDDAPVERESADVPVERGSDDVPVERGSNDDDEVPVEEESDDDGVPTKGSNNDDNADREGSLGVTTDDQANLRDSLQQTVGSEDSMNASSATDEEPMEATASLMVYKEDPNTARVQEEKHKEEYKTATIRTPSIAQLINTSSAVLPTTGKTAAQIENNQSGSTYTLPPSTIVTTVTGIGFPSLETSLSGMNASSSTMIPSLPSVGTILGNSLTGTSFMIPSLGTSPWLMSAGSGTFRSGLSHPPTISRGLCSSGLTPPNSSASSNQFISLLREPSKSAPVSTVSRITGDNDIITTSQATPTVLSTTLPLSSQFQATPPMAVTSTSLVSSATTNSLSALLKHDHRPIRDRMTIISNSYGTSSETLNTGIKPIPSVLPLTSIQSTSSSREGEATGVTTGGYKHKKRSTTASDKQATPHTIQAPPLTVIQSMPLSSGVVLPPSFQPWNIAPSPHVTGSELHGNGGPTGNTSKTAKTSSKSATTDLEPTTSNIVGTSSSSLDSNSRSSGGPMVSSVISGTLPTLPRFSAITYPSMSLPPVLVPPPFVTPSLSSILTSRSHMKTSVPSTHDHTISSAPSPNHPTSAPSPNYSSFVPSLKTSAPSSDHVTSSVSIAPATTTATPSSLRPVLHHSLPTGLSPSALERFSSGSNISGSGGVIPANPVPMVTSQTQQQQLPIIRAPIVSIPTMDTLPQTEASSVVGVAHSSVTSKGSPSVIMTPSISLPPVSYIMERDSKGNSPVPGGVKQEGGGGHEGPTNISEVDKVTANQLKLAQQKLAALQKHSYSQLSRPADLSSFEHIGSDSQGLVYWYDGGRNMYQSPKHLDHPGKLKDSEISLVCKSFVQWQNRLKQLRSSCHEADSKLAQIIKEVFLPRVKVATKRKPKDSASPQTSLVPISTSAPPTRDTTPTQFQPSPAVPGTIAATSLPSSSSNLLASTNIGPLMSQAAPIFVVPPNLLQSQCFPMLPVFANTAVIMPQNVSNPHSVGVEAVISRTEGIIEEGGSIKNEGVTIVPGVTTIGGVASSKKGNEGADEVVIERIEIHSPPPLPASSGKSPASKPSLEATLPYIKKEKPSAISGNVPLVKNIRPSDAREDRESSTHHQPRPLLIQSFGHPGGSLPPFMLHNPLSSGSSSSTSGSTSTSSSTSNISMGGVGVIQVEPEVIMGQFDPHTKSMEILGEVPIRLVTREESRDRPEGVLPRSAVSGGTPVTNTGSPDLRNRNDGGSDPSSRSEGMGTSLSKLSSSSALSLSSHFKATTDTMANDSQQSHTPHEVMSAEMLLSLHDREHNSESPSIPPAIKLPHPSVPKSATPPISTTTTATTSRGKKNRKQTPVASARVATPTISSHHGDQTPTPPVKDNNKVIEKKEDHTSSNKKEKGRELFPTGATLSSNQSKPRTQDKQGKGLSSNISSSSNETSTTTTDSSFNITPTGGSRQTKHASTLQQTKPVVKGRGKAQRGGKAASVRGAAKGPGQRISEGRAVGLRNQKPHPPQSHDSDSESSECSSSGSESTSDVSSPSLVKQSSLGGLNPSSNESEDETTSSGSDDDDEEVVSTKAKGRGRGRGRSSVRGSVRLGVKQGGRAPKGRVEKLKPLRSLRTNQSKKPTESKKPAPVAATQKKKPTATATPANRKKQQISSPSVSTLVVKISRKLLQHAKQTTSSTATTGVKKKRKQPPPPPVIASEDDEDDKPFSDDDDILPPSSKHRRVSSEGTATRTRRKSGHDSSTDKPGNNPMLTASSNLSSFYTAQGVDLQTLSELTGDDTEAGDVAKNTSRSKRTCVRVREGITKLQEMLDTNGGAGGPAKGGSKAGSSNRDASTARSYSNPYVGKKRSRHPSSTTAGRSRSRRQSEDTSSSVHLDKQTSSSLSRHRTKYYFSTHMVNSAADAVWRGKMDSILDYHRVQSRSKGFLSPPHKQEFVGRDSSDSSSDSEPDEEKSKPVVTRQSQSAPSTRGSGRGRGRRGRRGRAVAGRVMGTRRSNRLAKTESSNEDNGNDNSEDDQQSVKEEPIVTRQRGNKRKAPQPSPPPTQLTSDEATSDNDSLSDNDIHRSPKRPRYTLQEGGTVGIASTSPLSTPRSDESCDDSPETGTARHEENIAQSVGRASGGGERRDKSSPIVPNEPQKTPLSVTTPDSTPVPHPQVEEMNYTIAHSTPESTPIATDQPQIQPHPPGASGVRHQEYRKGDSTTIPEGNREQHHTRSDRVQPPRVHTSNAPPTNQSPELMVAAQDKSSSINMYGVSQSGWPHQFMQGGYPYNPKLHPMTAYHTPQGVMAGNYPYPVPYPWPHPPQSSQHIATEQQQMRVGTFPHAAGSQSVGGGNWGQQGAPKPRSDHHGTTNTNTTKKDSSNSKKSANSNSSPLAPPYDHHQGKSGSGTVTSGVPTTLPPTHHPSQQQHHDHVTVSQQHHHASTGRGNTSSANVHQYHYQTQPQPVQMEPTAATPFQYGFDSRHAPFASAHMWQSSQHPQAAAAAAQAQLHPALMTHHLTQQGLWYAQQNPQQHGGGQVGMATMPHPPTGGVEKTRKGGGSN